MRSALRNNGLSIFFLALFLIALVAQSIVGVHEYNGEQRAHEEPTIGWLRYVVSSAFGEAVMENWQSEFLQFALFIFVTVWLVQKGSNESKELDQAGLQSDAKQKVGRHALPNSPTWARVGGWRTAIYSNSLILVMTAIFLGTWTIQSITSWRIFNSERVEHDERTVSWASYLTGADFWEKTLQNWQSEFLAVGTMAVFTIYFRQRGSPESKPVGEAHETTAASG
jgi:uncharacterized protein DUF6766